MLRQNACDNYYQGIVSKILLRVLVRPNCLYLISQSQITKHFN